MSAGDVTLTEADGMSGLPATVIAAATGGLVTADDQVVTPAGDLIYANFLGRVKLARYGLPVLELGAWDEPDAVVAAWRKAVA